MTVQFFLRMQILDKARAAVCSSQRQRASQRHSPRAALRLPIEVRAAPLQAPQAGRCHDE
jgi:hypothetical protein